MTARLMTHEIPATNSNHDLNGGCSQASPTLFSGLRIVDLNKSDRGAQFEPSFFGLAKTRYSFTVFQIHTINAIVSVGLNRDRITSIYGDKERERELG